MRMPFRGFRNTFYRPAIALFYLPSLIEGLNDKSISASAGHTSLATTQKYLEHSKKTEQQLEAMKLPF